MLRPITSRSTNVRSSILQNVHTSSNTSILLSTRSISSKSLTFQNLSSYSNLNNDSNHDPSQLFPSPSPSSSSSSSCSSTSSKPHNASTTVPGISLNPPDMNNIKNNNKSKYLVTDVLNSRLMKRKIDKPNKNPYLPNFDTFNRSHASSISSTTEKRDVMQLWSLLEACLQSNYFDRAKSILNSLYMINSHRKYFIDDYNLYLKKLSDSNRNNINLDQILMDDLKTKFKSIHYNDRTLSILIHHSLSSTSNKHVNIKTYLNMNRNGIKEILKNIDILNINDFQKLYNDLKFIQQTDIPPSIRSILHQESMKTTTSNTPNPTQSSEQQHEIVRLDNSVESIKKQNTEELVAVDTIGMKVIRHTLLGLSLNETQRNLISNYNFEPNENIMNNNNHTTASRNDLDFFEIYKSLTNESERETFESILEQFNIDRQRALESRAADAAKERWKHDFEEAKERGDLSIRKSLNVKLWNWYELMLPILKKEIEKAQLKLEKQSKIFKSQDFDPYLLLVNPEKMCVITILELLKLNSTGGVIEGMRTARAVISVGKAIEMEFRSEQLLKNESSIFKDINKKSAEFKKIVQRAKSNFRSTQLEKSKIFWPQAVRAQIGSILISTLIHVAKIDVEGFDPITKTKVYGEAPAFAHSYQYCNGMKLGVIKIHKALINQLNGERLVASVQPQLLPMLVEPREWKNWRSGGYFYTQSTLIRSKESPEQLAYLKAVSDKEAIDDVYNGLNALGKTAWTVNKRLFEIISKVWNEGIEFLDIPQIQYDMQLIPPPPRNSDPSILREWKLQNKEIANKISKNRSIRCDTNYKLEIARAFLGEKFYFPHNLDFRGRAYPLSPHFNHLGNDLSRGLLIFWKGKKLGPDGLSWLKIHCANLYGMDKIPFTERIQFIEDHIEDVKDTAENPLDGKGWWKKADKPWQLLATCIELNEALKLDNPEDFISHQPVHQDGTCNGLQHYAALGGDVEGATQVNLIPNERPQDVYRHVANLVKKRLEKAVLAGDKKAELLVDKITRKVVKQPVMTNVYGVTYVGATFQIEKQLSEYFPDRKQCFDLSKYLTFHVFATIRELFHSAHLIQDWLGECAKRITKSIRLDVDGKSFKNGNKPDFMSSVIWTTPLGLPIVQPYREATKKQVMTNLQTIFISDPFAINGVNARRQKAGFPPNFIHSLDASHMLLSAIKCKENGLEFASVHDSYWTHACDVNKMSVYLRDEFIELHKVDLIERLKDEFDERYKDYVQIVKIGKTTELANKILKWRKEQSEKLGRPLTLADEIHMEKKRQDMLNSESATVRAKGSKLVTSISLVEDVKEIDELKPVTESMSVLVIVPLKLPEIPSKGDFDVQNVRESKYFFS
ncbi:DNA-directed RNA polymerase NDAI_0G03060 [Naumovozyma dairenensis CBS 421]|uniref:DNA-directed RNA polymerase n=1 Tax=Naumovozyma dairenensis (strain ATCC 10597 / BCRC 20456 / CBS 421 / NBRC 0211 / NRRL Y-12639) TaxID=1071378 RepID=G0WE72_NAUDC|nr:hypothetical protein NDAI_0G03060 [Naumovozyma dairenensis CBS 421]CCD26083.2 hypothetical protein NDAI_0G03060 [Naumovozyma dairenensis CBS 421]